MPTSPILIFDPDPVRCAFTVATLSRKAIDVLAFDKRASLYSAIATEHRCVVFLFDGEAAQSAPKSAEHSATELDSDAQRIPLATFVGSLTQQPSQPQVYAFSAVATVDEAVSCMRLGAADFVSLSDFDLENLEEIARAALSQRDDGSAAKPVVAAASQPRDDFADRLITTAQGTRHFANCATFPELATQALKVMRGNLKATGGALFLLHNSRWQMMHAADLAHDFVLECPHDHALEAHFAGRNASSEGAGDGPLSRFLRKQRGAVVAFSLRSPEGAMTGLLLVHRPNTAAFDERDFELGRLIMAHVTEALKSIRLTQSLRESEARFHSIASNVPGVVFQARCGPGEIASFTYMSDSSSEVFGIRPERFLFAPVVFLERVVVDDLPALLRSLRESVDTLTPWRWEGRILGEGGRTHWIQLSARPSISEDHPQEVTYDGLMLDITESKELEFQLQLADRMISVGTLAAGVAHEINNPLTYVLANLGLIREELADLGEFQKRNELETLLEEASEGAERVTQIVRDLKVFSRGDEQQADTAISVERVLESSLNMATNELRHRAHVVRDFRDVPFVRANHARLGQVFINLLINAAQAIPEGHVDENTVNISLTSDAQGRVVISIQDTGTGIPEEARKRIFDPFFTTKPVGVGTGLGLPICHRILEEIGGEISVESAPGRGSTFTVVLPGCEATPEEIKAEESASESNSIRKARILIVDDEPGVVAALKRGLRNHDVTLALGGQDALEILLEDHANFDVIFCDLMMPQFSGIDLFNVLERDRPHFANRVVFMTGGAFTARAKNFLRETENAHISKPFLLRDIEALIRSRVTAPREPLPITGKAAFDEAM